MQWHRGVAVLALALASATPTSLLAANFTWDGGSVANDNWSTPQNWNPDGAPATDGSASLIFDGLVRPGPVNDFAAATSFSNVSFATTAGTFTLSGNSIGLSGNVTDSTATVTQSANLNVALTNGSHTIHVASTGTLAIGGILSGAGASVTKTGFGTLALSAGNTYTGATVVRNGTLTLDFANPAAPTSQILYTGAASGRNLTIGKTLNDRSSDIGTIGYSALVATGSSAGAPTPVNQTFDATTFGDGVSRVAVTKGTDPGSSTTVDLGSITHTLGGATFFLLPTKSVGSVSRTSLTDPGIFVTPTLTATAGTVHTTSTNSNGTTGAANGILGGWAYITDTLIGLPAGNTSGSFEVAPPGQGILAATELASVDASGNIVPFTGYTNLGPTNGTGSNLKIVSNPNSVVNFKTIYSDKRATAQFLANTIAGGQITVQFAPGTDTSQIQVGQFFSGNGTNLEQSQIGLIWSSVVAIDSPTQIRLQPAEANTVSSLQPSAWSVYAGNAQQLDLATAGLTDVNSIRIEESTGRRITIGTNNTLRLGKTGAIFKDGYAEQSHTLIGTQGPTAHPGFGIQDDGTLTAGGPDVAGAAQAGELFLQVNSPSDGNEFSVTARITDNPGDDNNPNAGGPNGAVTLVKTGGGQMQLSGHNTYSGGTYILEGLVIINIAGTASGSTANPDGFGTGPVHILPGGQWFAIGGAVAGTFTNDLFIAGNGGRQPFGAIRFGTGGTFASKITLTGDARLAGGDTNTVITGQITGNHNLEMGALATFSTNLRLANPNSSGPNVNNWTGDMTIRGRTGGTGLIHLGTLTTPRSEQIPNGAGFGNLIMLGGPSSGNNATLDLNGATETINGLIGTTNPGQVFIENQRNSSTGTLIVGDGDASSTFNGTIWDNGGGAATGKVQLTKIGSGTLRAGGPLTYTGTTTINAGTLQLDATQALKKLKLDGATASLSLNTATSSTKSFEVGSADGTLDHGANAFSVVGGSGETITWNSGSQLHVQGGSGGKLMFNAGAGTTVSVADNTSQIIVHPGATLELAGSVSTTSSGANFVNIQNDSTTSLHVTGTGQAVGNLDGAGNTTVDGSGILTASRVVQNSLTIGDPSHGAPVVTIRRSGGTPQGLDSQVSVVNFLSIENDQAPITAPPPVGYSSAIRQYFGSLDLQNNDLIVTGGSPALFAEVQDMIRAGLFSNGARGISSHEALFTGPYAGLTWLGSIYNGFDDDSNPNTPDTPILTSFDGIPLVGGELLLKYTWFGDADLDGLVTPGDDSLLSAGFGDPLLQATNPWLFGDFDYNGLTDPGDSSLLGAGYGGSGNGAISLPEPGGFVLAALALAGACGLLSRSRRRAHLV